MSWKSSHLNFEAQENFESFEDWVNFFWVVPYTFLVIFWEFVVQQDYMPCIVVDDFLIHRFLFSSLACIDNVSILDICRALNFTTPPLLRKILDLPLCSAFVWLEEPLHVVLLSTMPCFVTFFLLLFTVEANDESFACKNCGKMYSNPASLIGHLKYKCNTGEITKIHHAFLLFRVMEVKLLNN